jgi:hypothetical protein
MPLKVYIVTMPFCHDIQPQIPETMEPSDHGMKPLKL